MSLLALYFLLVPGVCAMLAGTVVWASNRNTVLDDGSLIRHFVCVLTVCLLIAWGLTQTTTFRLRTDPGFKMQTELAADPLYQAVKEHAPDDEKKLIAFLAIQISQGQTLKEALAQARPLLSEWMLYRVAFADQKTVLRWAQVSIDALKELRDKDPALCVNALLPLPMQQHPGSVPFSAANASAFRAAVIDIYASANRTMRHVASPTDLPETLEDMQREYRVIADLVQQRFGLKFGEGTAKATVAQLTSASPAHVCNAFIFRLEVMQALPQPIAAGLLRGTLRD